MTITATSDNQLSKSNIRNWTIGLQTFATGSLPRSGLVQRDVMEYLAVARGSLRLNVRRTDHLGPLLGFRRDEAAKVGGRARNHCTAQIGEPCLKLGIGEARVDLLVELVDDLGRRGLRCADAEPDGRLIPSHEI